MKTKILFTTVIAVATILIGIVFLRKGGLPNRVIPSPNGYDDFVQAGKVPTVYASDLSLEELQDYVKTNRPSLDLIRIGLKKNCAVSFNYSPAGFSSHVTDVMAIKAGAHLLVTEGNLAERENRFADAAKIYVELIEYGCVSGKGGVNIDKMVSRACELMGIAALTNVVSKLQDRRFCQITIEKLEKLNSERESLDQADANEQAWGRQRGLQIKTRIADFFSGQSRRIKNGLRKQMIELPLQSAQLAVIFAARIFEIDNGRRPTKFSDLVPTYLKIIPVNPNTGKEIPFSLELSKPTNEILL